MKRKIIALFACISALCVGGISLSLAWFASENSTTVENLEIKLNSKNLLISTDGVNFIDDTLSKNGHENEAFNLSRIDEFKPVSSMFASKWIENKDTYPRLRRNYSTPSAYVMGDTKSTNAGYYTQALYFKYTSNEKLEGQGLLTPTATLTIDPKTTTFEPDREENAVMAKTLYSADPGSYLDYGATDEEKIARIEEELNGVSKSLRLSVLNADVNNYNYYIINPDESEIPGAPNATLFGGIMNNKQGLDVFSSYLDTEVLFGECQNTDKIVYVSPNDPGYNANRYFDDTKPVSCFNAKTDAGNTQIDIEASIANGLVIKQEPSIALKNVDDILGIKMVKDEVVRIVITIYLEGWDRDNINVTMHGKFKTHIGFKLRAGDWE